MRRSIVVIIMCCTAITDQSIVWHYAVHSDELCVHLLALSGRAHCNQHISTFCLAAIRYFWATLMLFLRRNFSVNRKELTRRLYKNKKIKTKKVISHPYFMISSLVCLFYTDFICITTDSKMRLQFAPNMEARFLWWFRHVLNSSFDNWL